MRKLFQPFSDHLGIASAVLCLIHCMVAPVAMGAVAHAHTHTGVFGLNWDLFFLSLGLVAVWFSSRHTHQSWLKVMLWVSYSLLALTILLEKSGPVLVTLAYIASFTLIVGHVMNLIGKFRIAERG